MLPRIITPTAAELQQGRAATPIAFIRAILAAYRHYGIDSASALAAAQIDPALFNDTTTCSGVTAYNPLQAIDARKLFSSPHGLTESSAQ